MKGASKIRGDEPIGIREQRSGMTQEFPAIERHDAKEDTKQIDADRIEPGRAPHLPDAFQSQFRPVYHKVARDEDKEVHAGQSHQFQNFQQTPRDGSCRRRCVHTKVPIDVQAIVDDVVHHNASHSQDAKQFKLYASASSCFGFKHSVWIGVIAKSMAKIRYFSEQANG